MGVAEAVLRTPQAPRTARVLRATAEHAVAQPPLAAVACGSVDCRGGGKVAGEESGRADVVLERVSRATAAKPRWSVVIPDNRKGETQHQRQHLEQLDVFVNGPRRDIPLSRERPDVQPLGVVELEVEVDPAMQRGQVRRRLRVTLLWHSPIVTVLQSYCANCRNHQVTSNAANLGCADPVVRPDYARHRVSKVRGATPRTLSVPTDSRPGQR